MSHQCILDMFLIFIMYAIIQIDNSGEL